MKLERKRKNKDSELVRWQRRMKYFELGVSNHQQPKESLKAILFPSMANKINRKYNLN